MEIQRHMYFRLILQAYALITLADIDMYGHTCILLTVVYDVQVI